MSREIMANLIYGLKYKFIFFSHSLVGRINWNFARQRLLNRLLLNDCLCYNYAQTANRELRKTLRLLYAPFINWDASGEGVVEEHDMVIRSHKNYFQTNWINEPSVRIGDCHIAYRNYNI